MVPIWRRNADNARCVRGVLQCITDPEVIDSAIRVAGITRWFDGGSDHNPPYDKILSTFESCFDSTKQLYPGLRDRAYFSARAILQINTGAKLQSRDHALKYPIPAVSSGPHQHADPDFQHIIRMFECNSGPDRPAIDFPRGGINTPAHLMWMSNLFVDQTCIGPNPTLRSYESYLSIATTDHQAMIANVLFVWYMLLGGRVEEEIFWAIDKSCAVISSFISYLLTFVYTSDVLETILYQLPTRVMDVITDGNCIHHLKYLLEFLEAWEKRPACLTPMVYQWCSALSEVAKMLGQDGTHTGQHSQFPLTHREEQFSEVGPGCDLLRLDDTTHVREHPRGLNPGEYADLLFVALKVGFRGLVPGRDQPAKIHLDYTPHDHMFETAFSSDDDEVIADAVCAWIAGDHAPAGSFSHYFIKRVEKATPFSPRLRQAGICAIGSIWRSEPTESVLETVRLLNRLNADLDDVEKDSWQRLLIGVTRSLVGSEGLPSHYWCLLGELLSTTVVAGAFALRDMEVMKSLEEAEDLEKLEVWMAVVWQSLPFSGSPVPEPIEEGIEQVTLGLVRRRPSALQRFENLCERGAIWDRYKATLQGICDQARP